MITDLKLLVSFLDKTKVNQLEIFTHSDFKIPKSKMGKLFNLIKENDFANISELQNKAYGVLESEWGFKKLIFRFKEKLFSTLFFVDTNTPLFNERTKAYYICSRRALLIRMVIERGARSLAVEISENTLPICIKYEFTELTVLISKFLLRQYSGNYINTKKYGKYSKIFIDATRLYNLELSMEEISSSIIFKRNSSKQSLSKFKFNKDTDENLQKAIAASKGNPSIELIINCSTIILDHFTETKDFDKFREWTFYFAEKTYAKSFISVITLEVLISAQLRIALITKDSRTAKEFESKYFAKLNVGNFNWYVVCLYYVLTMLHCREYSEALAYLDFILTQKSFEKQPPSIQENYFIVQAYCQYLILIDKSKILNGTKEFRVAKFLNQVPEFSRDKQGSNVSILIVQILFFIADKKYSKIIDRIESLNLYSYRHLKKDEHFRSQCFIRMISEMVRADFRKQGTIFRTEKLLHKMKAVPIDTYPATAETEIIPYEDLWEMVVERLD